MYRTRKLLVSLSIALWFAGYASAAPSAPRFILAENGTARCSIVLADDAIVPEQTAAAELAAYLGKVTGATFAVVKEGQQTAKGPRIYVGPTAYATACGIDCDRLGPERWVMRTSADGHLVLAGGRPRGTLYAVYHFLEDSVGVHWWSPWEESVPSLPDLSIAPVDRHGEPVFRYRSLNVAGGIIGGQPPRFTARNRVNRTLNGIIPFKYGGGDEFGPPYFVHTEGQFIYRYKAEINFKRNPEWFAMKNGERRVHNDQVGWSSKNQLCLSNPELREAFLKRLKKNIQETRDQPCPPMIFDISLNDVPALCECDACQAIVKKYGADSGLLLDFVNYMADGIRGEYPNVMIETLAYLNTETVPKGIVPRANVIVTLCDTKSTYTAPVARDGYFASRLAEWSKITNNVFVWDYHFNPADIGLPLPHESTFQSDLQLFRQYNVTGFMSEYHNPIFEELRDMRLWLLAKLLEDPYQNQQTLIETFTEGFYGPAGGYIRTYVDELGKASKAHPTFINPMGRMTSISAYLTPSFILKAQKIFDDAEKAAGGSDVLSRRVNHARMALDKATLAFFPKIWAQWEDDGKKREDLPLDRDQVASRLRNTVEAQWRLRADRVEGWYKRSHSKHKAAYLAKIDQYLKQSPVSVRPPAKFAHLAWQDYTAYGTDAFGIYDGSTKVVEDKHTQNGNTCRTELTEKSLADHLGGCALRWDMHDHTKTSTGKEPTVRCLKVEDIVPGPGYHWYKLGRYTITENNFLWIYGANIAAELSDARDPLNTAAEYDIWARLRFDGPAFSADKESGENIISIEWVVVVKAGKMN